MIVIIGLVGCVLVGISNKDSAKKNEVAMDKKEEVLDVTEEVLEEYDEIVHIALSHSLSSSYETAVMLSND